MSAPHPNKIRAVLKNAGFRYGNGDREFIVRSYNGLTWVQIVGAASLDPHPLDRSYHEQNLFAALIGAGYKVEHRGDSLYVSESE